MTDETTGDGAVPDADPSASATTPAPHHGEALVAALLDSEEANGHEGLARAKPGPQHSAPLTASTVISHTDTVAFQPDSGGDAPRATAQQSDDTVGEDAAARSDQSGDSPAGDDEEETTSFGRNLLEWVVVLGAAVAVAIILRTFVFQAFFIPSESMETTLFENDRILVNKVSYRLHDVNRGDVVVFRRPDDQPGEIRDLIKRVIALPGETVEGRDGTIYIDGQLLVEPYLDDEPFGDFGPTTVPADEVFMMGDNRDQSLDSRRFGTISEDRIVGRAFFLFWPFDRMGTL